MSSNCWNSLQIIILKLPSSVQRVLLNNRVVQNQGNHTVLLLVEEYLPTSIPPSVEKLFSLNLTQEDRRADIGVK